MVYQRSWVLNSGFLEHEARALNLSHCLTQKSIHADVDPFLSNLFSEKYFKNRFNKIKQELLWTWNHTSSWFSFSRHIILLKLISFIIRLDLTTMLLTHAINIPTFEKIFQIYALMFSNSLWQIWCMLEQLNTHIDCTRKIWILDTQYTHLFSCKFQKLFKSLICNSSNTMPHAWNRQIVKYCHFIFIFTTFKPFISYVFCMIYFGTMVATIV